MLTSEKYILFLGVKYANLWKVHIILGVKYANLWKNLSTQPLKFTSSTLCIYENGRNCSILKFLNFYD